jgi:hypothetical protein
MSAAKQAISAICSGVFVRGRCADGFEAGTKEMEECLGGGCTGGGLALHTGLQPGGGGLFCHSIRQYRIPKRSEPCKHRAETGAHGGTAVVGVTDKMVAVREIEVPEDPVQKFCAIVGIQEIPISSIDVNCEAGVANLLCIRAGYTSGIVRLPE